MSIALHYLLFLLILVVIILVLFIRLTIKQKKRIENLASTVEALETLLDRSTDLYWLKDRNYRLTFVNNAYKKLFPNVKDFIGKTDHDLAESFLADGYRADDEKVMSTGEEFHYQENDKGHIWFETTKIPIFQGANREVIGCGGTAKNITDLKAQETKVYELEHLDYLSGLSNRYSFVNEYKDYIDQLIREGKPVMLVMINIDYFSKLNAINGFGIGDQLIRKVSFEIRNLTREFKIKLARVDGDEFCIIMDENPLQNDLAHLISKVQEIFKAPFNVEGENYYLRASIGATIAPNDGNTFDRLYRNVELALRDAKTKNHNKSTYYADLDAKQLLKILAIEVELATALKNDEFYIVFQPKIDINIGKNIGAEALLRWKNNRLGELTPLEFIDIASRLRYIIDIGYWMIEKTITQNLEWGSCGYTMNPISINLDTTQFFDPNLSKVISELIIKYNYPANLIEFEISENNFIADYSNSCRIVQELHQLGVRISIDDFGLDFVNILKINKFDIDCIKINRQYLEQASNDQKNRTLLKSIVDSINDCKIVLMVSNVENPDELDRIKDLHIDLAQGYYYKKPLQSKEFAAFLKKS